MSKLRLWALAAGIGAVVTWAGSTSLNLSAAQDATPAQPAQPAENGAATGQNVAEGDVKLRYRWAVDAHQRYRFTGRTVATVAMPASESGEPFTATTVATTILRTKVLATSPAGEADLGFAIEALGLTYEDPEKRVAYHLGQSTGDEGNYGATSRVDGADNKLLSELDLWPGADWATAAPPTLGEDIATAKTGELGGLHHLATRVPAAGKSLVSYLDPASMAALIVIPLPETGLADGTDWVATVPAPAQIPGAGDTLTLNCRVTSFVRDGEKTRAVVTFTIATDGMAGVQSADGEFEFVAEGTEVGRVSRAVYRFATDEQLGDGIRMQTRTEYVFRWLTPESAGSAADTGNGR